MEFRDHQGRRLTINPTVGTLRRVKQQTTINLLDAIVADDAGQPTLLIQLADDDILLAEVLHAACDGQIDDTLDDWIAEMPATVLADGHAALVKALPVFFRHPEQRQYMQILATRAGEAFADGREKALQAISHEPETTGSPSPSAVQESPDLNQTPEPLAS